MELLQPILFLLLCLVALGWIARHFKFSHLIALDHGDALGFVPRRLLDDCFSPQN